MHTFIGDDRDMRTVNTQLVDNYADQLRPLLPIARRAYGTQGPNSPARLASVEVNKIIKEYVDERGGNITHLAHALEDQISLPGLRRRLRAARGTPLGSFSTSPKRGTTDPEQVKVAAQKIMNARSVGKTSYREAIREVYASNVSLSAVAEECDMSYYSLWAAGSAG